MRPDVKGEAFSMRAAVSYLFDIAEAPERLLATHAEIVFEEAPRRVERPARAAAREPHAGAADVGAPGLVGQGGIELDADERAQRRLRTAGPRNAGTRHAAEVFRQLVGGGLHRSGRVALHADADVRDPTLRERQRRRGRREESRDRGRQRSSAERAHGTCAASSSAW